VPYNKQCVNTLSVSALVTAVFKLGPGNDLLVVLGYLSHGIKSGVGGPTCFVMTETIAVESAGSDLRLVVGSSQCCATSKPYDFEQGISAL